VGGSPELPARLRHLPSATTQVARAAAFGVVVGVVASFLTEWQLGLLMGIDAATALWVARVWLKIRPLHAEQTAALAQREDPRRATADLLLLTAAIASLGAVVLVLARAAHTSHGRDVLVALGLASVALAWLMVHTLFTLIYARQYYGREVGGIDFNQRERPSYRDFAYLAFTIGMTFQVSDTSITDKAIRRTALRHALLSYLLGTGILATTVNLVASLTSTTR
jgi:uncharacterized membrane protein